MAQPTNRPTATELLKFLQHRDCFLRRRVRGEVTPAERERYNTERALMIERLK